MNQLFRIQHEAWQTLSPEEVVATCEGLKKMDLFHLPYEEVDLEFPVHTDVIRWMDSHTGKIADDGINFKNGKPLTDWSKDLIVRYEGLSLIGVKAARLIDPTGISIDITQYMLKNALVLAASGFICLLATKNIVKETREDKLAKLGIGRRKHKYRYITTISLPREMDEDHEHRPTGEARRPHWRRGHVRNQHYGPGFQFVKQIWIKPVFVNADPAFVERREAYNVSAGRSK